MAERLERHHILWERRNWSQRPIAKQVRLMGAFLLDLTVINHRLLHASMTSPEVPDHDTLCRMRELAISGLNEVINKLNHPISEHIDTQLYIANLSHLEALERIDGGEYIKGRYGTRK